MASIGTSAVKLIDDDNDVVTVTGNKLDVNAEASGHSTATHESMNTINDSVEQLPPGVCKEAFLQADEDNTGYIMIGGSGVGDNQGMKLNPGDTLIVNVSNTNVLYAIGSASGQNLRVMRLA
tara:strand:- start:255 stop:620 length:366 start_codon:yes stop_codon:yes gene_type:complete